MKPFIQKHESKLRFGLVGAVNTAIDFGVLFLLNGLGINKYLANFASTTVAFIFSFFANRSFTFKSRGSAKKQIVPFLIVTLAGLWVLQPVVIWLMSFALVAFEESLALFIAKIVATGVSLVWNFVLYNRFVFRDSNANNRPATE